MKDIHIPGNTVRGGGTHPEWDTSLSKGTFIYYFSVANPPNGSQRKPENPHGHDENMQDSTQTLT